MTRRFIISTSLAVLLAWLTLSLSSCGGESNDTPTPEPTLAPMKLYISVPQANSGESTRVGDPGEDASETEDWDNLTVIIAYTKKTTGAGIVDNDPQKMVYYDTFTKDEFDSKTIVKHTFSELGPEDSDGLHTYTMYLPLGKIRVYGVTYSKDSNGIGMPFEGSSNLKALLDAIPENGQDHTSDIENLKITNDYASTSAGMDLNKFLSVATGYAKKVNINETSTVVRDMEISKSSSDVEDRYWRMPLSRLATKLDIQWDAKGAYAANSSGKITYTDVTVDGFTYDGGASSLGENEQSGYGRLFPTLSSTEPVGGTKIFYNTAAISKRNGRVYHYLFPDGSTSPKVTFNLTTTEEDASTSQTKEKEYDLKFSTSLQPAAWYKVNVTINGQSTTNSVVINNNFSTGN